MLGRTVSRHATYLAESESMFPDGPFWEWQFGEIPLLLSAVLIALSRPIWLLAKLVIYASFASISSRRWVVRCCVRLWMWTNWDIGTALLGMVRRSWGLESGMGSPGNRRVSMDIHYVNDGGDSAKVGGPGIQLPVDGIASTIEDNDAISQSFENIGKMDKRQRYIGAFQAELAISAERQNARQLERQARGKWYRIRAIARWLSDRIRRL